MISKEDKLAEYRIHFKNRTSDFIVCKEENMGEGVKYLPLPNRRQVLPVGTYIGEIVFDEMYDLSGLSQREKNKKIEEIESIYPDAFFFLKDRGSKIGKVGDHSIINKMNHTYSDEANCKILDSGFCVSKKKINVGDFLHISYGCTRLGRHLNSVNNLKKKLWEEIKDTQKRKGPIRDNKGRFKKHKNCLLYTSPSPRD